MTGFSRRNGEFSCEGLSKSWFFEIKSVNGKALDIKLRLPSGFDNLSAELKAIAGKYLSRGSVSAYLEFNNSLGELKINDSLLQTLTIKALELFESYGERLQKPSPTDLLAFKGVIENGEPSLEEAQKLSLERTLVTDFEQACQTLQQDRRAEGEKIKIALLDILDKIANITLKIERIAQGMPTRLKEKLQNQIDELLAASNQISEERLAQEVVLYVAKADIREEIDRLQAHLKTAQDLLNQGGEVGRRLDFLCQELNREANTTCSKSGDIELTNLGMALKTLIEQFREQVQNIE